MTEKRDVVIVGARLAGSCSSGWGRRGRPACGIDVTIVEQQSRYLAARA